jgi:hypothetical protein
VGTRSNIQCLEKWYQALCPSMVSRGQWGSGDDRRLLRSLYALCAGEGARAWEVDWSSLVRGRTAAQARRRWRLMARGVPGARDSELADVVAALVARFLPQLPQRLAAEQAAAEEAEEAG